MSSGYRGRGTAVIEHDDEEVSESNPLPVTSTNKTQSNLEGKGFFPVGISRVELDFSGSTESIIISAHISNTGIIYIGGSTVTNDGSNAVAFLDVGESLSIDYDDSINAIYVVSDTADQQVMAGAGL